MNGIGQDLRFGCWAEVVEGLQASFLDGCVGLASGSHLVREPNFRRSVPKRLFNLSARTRFNSNRPIF